MEASVAAPAGDGAAEAAEGQAPAVDFSPVLQQIEAVGGRLGQMEQLIQQFAAPDGEGEEDDATLAALAEFYGAGGQEQQQAQAPQFDADAAAKLVEAMQGNVSTQVQQALDPVMQQLGALTAKTNADMLQAELPELKKPEVAKAVIDGAVGLAQAAGLDPSVGRHPDVVRAVYKAMRYDQIAAGEVPVDELQHPSLEPGGGASPRGGVGATGGTAQDILAARGGNSFWGT
ncbi:hypothetical protein DSM104299_03233 [Baekduia alba]|uniref:hypothetical protein n=1 Tax=Baekduia alba TaxID=2997333 RepID=UPI002341179C|nr:hypothetical protein [Baekduia alba]WCB94496.1 hypothetical protein DSM104299_03233 [Baekduia alba]